MQSMEKYFVLQLISPWHWVLNWLAGAVAIHYASMFFIYWNYDSTFDQTAPFGQHMWATHCCPRTINVRSLELVISRYLCWPVTAAYSITYLMEYSIGVDDTMCMSLKTMAVKPMTLTQPFQRLTWPRIDSMLTQLSQNWIPPSNWVNSELTESLDGLESVSLTGLLLSEYALHSLADWKWNLAES